LLTFHAAFENLCRIPMNSIVIIGLGYVGLPLSLLTSIPKALRLHEPILTPEA